MLSSTLFGHRVLTSSSSLTLRYLIRFASSSNSGGGKFFDRLLPEDPPELKAYKARESRLIRAQMGRSKFMDAHRAKGADKLFVATGDLSAPSADAVFPEFELEPVISRLAIPSSEIFSKSRATIVTIAFQGLGQAQLIPWHAALSRAAAELSSTSSSSSPSYQITNILFLQGWFWRLVRGIIAQSTANSLTPTLASTTFTALQPSARETDHFCDALQIHNRMMAHIFILDTNGAVRWSAHGEPAEGETDALIFAATTLSTTPQRNEFIKRR